MPARYGRYEVLYRLGQGAMAQVFLAKDPVLSRFVAVKVLHAGLASRQDVLHRFFNEARTVAVIRNPHVVEVFDFGQEGKDLYLVMEFVDGLSLHGLMRRGPSPRSPEAEPGAWAAPGREDAPAYAPLDPAVAAALICQAAEGLSIASQQGVVHRDLKPENLMINTQGYLKISDFGIAHVQDDSLTKTGAVLGSPLYMSPEQARGLKPITSQSDMFSLGAVFYACLAGHPPFQGRTVTELFRRISSEPHPPLGSLRPGLDPGLGNLIDTLLRKPPAERGGGPRWLQRQLKSYLSGLGVTDPAELIAGHLREANARGLQTTLRPDARNETLPMTVAATQAASALPRPGQDVFPPVIARAAVPALSTRRTARNASPARGPGLRALALAFACLGIGLFAGVRGLPGFPRKGREAPSASAGHVRVTVAGGSSGTGFASGREPADFSLSGPSGASGRPDPVANAASPVVADASPADPIAVGGTDSPGGDGPFGNDGVAPGIREAKGQGTAAPGQAESRENEATLILKSSPPFAEAYVDGRFLGTTPIRLDHLAPGRHRMGLRSPRLPRLDTTLIFSAGMHALKVRLDAGPGLRMAAIPVEGD